LPAARPSRGRAGTGETPPTDLVELGVVRGAYGIKGWVRIAPHDMQATVLRATRQWWMKAGDTVEALEVTGVRRHGAGVVAKWAGCENPEDAEKLRGALIAVARGEFPAPAEGEFYWVDLVGARVVNRAGADLGKVTGLRNNGAQDLLEVADETGAGLLIPLVDTYVETIDTAQRLIRVDWEKDW
jgi:16S rRNA processing protein RimM